MITSEAPINPSPRGAPSQLLDALKAYFGDRFSVAASVREHHGRDESPFATAPPDGVVYVESTQDVAVVIQKCAHFKVPVIPYGAGSSIEGQLLAVQGGISVDVSRMNKILQIHADDLTVTVQPGVTRKQLNESIRDTGLFFPIDPGADASIGGMCATRASGTNAVRYGTMRENVLALEVVLPSGEVIRTGTRAKKSSAGYDLTRLMVGSEGTLGLFTEITLRLYPQPEAISAATCSFEDIRGAVRTVIETVQLGVPIARVELIDKNAVRMVNAHSRLSLTEAPMLLMEFHGSANSVEEQVQIVQEISSSNGDNAFEWATTTEERNRLWTARHNAYFAAIQSRPGCRSVTTDACVPISQLAECLLESIADAESSSTPYFLVGHVGDGNFHFGYLIDPESAEERGDAENLNARLVARALRLGGTCTGEHGIGLHKMHFLLDEAGASGVHVMRSIKNALDPHNIMNPGKIFELC